MARAPAFSREGKVFLFEDHKLVQGEYKYTIEYLTNLECRYDFPDGLQLCFF